MKDDFLTISELNQYVKDVVNAGFPQPLWVCGEIQGFNRNAQKSHIFFELIEKDDASQDVRAKIGLVLFAGVKPAIQAALKLSENAFNLKDDIEVKFLCKIDFYAPHGIVRLIVEGIDPYYTLGKLAQDKQKLVAELEKKGVFKKNKELSLPLVPINIGLVSSFDSAAYNDFYDELKISGYGFKIFFQNALMQGKNAPEDIVRAVGRLAQVKNLDCIVITRGGGSLADLSCFDSRFIAEQIAVLNIPVLTGIGHEINISITDMAAHTSAKTPTAIAQFLIERIDRYISDIDGKLKNIIDLALFQVRESKQKINNQSHSLHQQTTQYLKKHNEHLIRLKEGIKNRPASYLKNKRSAMVALSGGLKAISVMQIKTVLRKIENYDRIVNAYHPHNTIRRGFSITRDKEGRAIKSIKKLNMGFNILTELSDGVINSEVKDIKQTGQ